MKKLIFTAILFSLVTGCTAPYVFNQPAKSESIQDLKSEKAQIIFLRPSNGVMGAFAAIVFDITNDKNEIIGVAPAESKFVVELSPGEHRLFATNGLQGHIMDMNVVSGKRYYVVVRPIYGNGFQLTPLKHNPSLDLSLSSAEFPLWKSKTKMVEKSDGVDQWYSKFKENIEKVKQSAITVWNAKSPAQRAQLTLTSEDAATNE